MVDAVVPLVPPLASDTPSTLAAPSIDSSSSCAATRPLARSRLCTFPRSTSSPAAPGVAPAWASASWSLRAASSLASALPSGSPAWRIASPGVPPLGDCRE
jgi:hypothetical protein